MQDLGSFPVFASLLAGILTFISPCILPLIPVYITLVTGLSVEELDNKKNKSMIKFMDFLYYDIINMVS